MPLFEKVLSASDAGRIGRLVLPKACAEVSIDDHLDARYNYVYCTMLPELPKLDDCLILAFSGIISNSCSGIFSTNLSTRRPSSENSGREGQRMGIPI